MNHHYWLQLLAAIAIYSILVAAVTFATINDYSAGEVIELPTDQWACEALDPADGQCATYTRQHP